MSLLDTIRRMFGVEPVVPFDQAEHDRRMEQIDRELYKLEDQVRREIRASRGERHSPQEQRG